MGERRYVDVIVLPNPGCPEGCTLRYKAEDEPRQVTALVHPDSGAVCEVVGWSSGGASPALAVTVEDSGSGTATLVYGGELGLRLTPRNGGAAFGEPYLLIDAADLIG